jgi:hypothetical protein
MYSSALGLALSSTAFDHSSIAIAVDRESDLGARRW